MNDDISDLLQRSTAQLAAPSDMLAKAHASGSRRLRRRRATVGASALFSVTLALVGVQVLHGPAGSRTETFAGPDPYGSMVDHPTTGDLAGDRTYLQAALTAWERSHKASANAGQGIFGDLRGEPWVAWAGQTPAGPAAVVAQKAFLHKRRGAEIANEGVTTVVGFVGVDAQGKPQLVGDAYPNNPDDLTTAWFVDPARTVLAAIDEGKPMLAGTQWRYRADGVADREYEPMTDADGAWIRQVPAVPDSGSVGVILGPKCSSCDGRNAVHRTLVHPPSTPGGEQGEPRLWIEARQNYGLSLQPDAVCGIEQLNTVTEAVGASVEINWNTLWPPIWVACGTLPDGRSLLLSERGVDRDATRLLGLINGKLQDFGVIDHDSALPVRAQVPGGWAVAAYGATMRSRIGSGPWSAQFRDAALIPAASTQVEVTTSGRTTVVDLRSPGTG